MAIKLVKSDGDLGPQTAERKPRRVGVIDIGSNSIRLVVFEGAPRAPFAIFNEKVLCGVGQRLQSTGKLDPDGVAAALDNLPRFVAAATAMEVEQLHTVATAAVRDALDGQSFVDAIEKRCGVTVKTIPGDEEARLSALGVIAGCPEADGIVGDLGG
ncbi:MAG: exopolyphosphatase, partial [Xanthobacteraceae bacterium]